MNDSLQTRRVLWLRARDASPSASAERCAALGTLDWGPSSFCDTCFHSSFGGVTLREQADDEAQFTWEKTHIHLDAVEGLGDFIEIEAPIGEPATHPLTRAQLEEAQRALGIREEALVQETYVELLRTRAPLIPEAR